MLPLLDVPDVLGGAKWARLDALAMTPTGTLFDGVKF